MWKQITNTSIGTAKTYFTHVLIPEGINISHSAFFPVPQPTLAQLKTIITRQRQYSFIHSVIHSFNHHIRSSAVSAQIKSFPKWSPVEWAWIENLYFSPTRISFLLNVSMILTIAWPSPSTLTPLLRQETILQLTHDRRLNRWLPHRPSLFSSKKLIQSAEVIFSKPTHDSRLPQVKG